MRIPSIHLNGTNGTDLIDQNVEAYEAIRAAIGAVERASPNARDFYPQGPDAYREAMAEHVARVKTLTELAEVYAKIADILQDPAL